MQYSTFVTSTNINHVGWENETLYIRFNSGITYQYDKVPHCQYAALAGAESVGKHFHHFIKPVFHHTRLDHDPFAPFVGVEQPVAA